MPATTATRVVISSRYALGVEPASPPPPQIRAAQADLQIALGLAGAGSVAAVGSLAFVRGLSAAAFRKGARSEKVPGNFSATSRPVSTHSKCVPERASSEPAHVRLFGSPAAGGPRRAFGGSFGMSNSVSATPALACRRWAGASVLC